MKINIYYGGRGIPDDPTLYVLEKMTSVLSVDLNVEVARYNIFEQKKQVSTLAQTINDADGIVLATTVEWLGIGGYMTTFLDALWLYGDPEKIATLYMQPVVISTTAGERNAMLTLENAWETLGGPLCTGLCGYVSSRAEFEANAEYSKIIGKKTENLYKAVSQKLKDLPTSNQAVSKTVLVTKRMQLTPEESEQLSQYVADDSYVKQQKEDIIELSSMYRNLLGGTMESRDTGTPLINAFTSAYVPQGEEWQYFVFEITDDEKALLVSMKGPDVECRFLSKNEAADAFDSGKEVYDIYARLTNDILLNITEGRETFQRAFRTGDMSARGKFEMIRMMDEAFPFGKDR